MTRRRIYLMSAGMILLVLLAGVYFWKPRPRLNLLLITLDTTRADRLGCYGYEQALTPALDALSKGGVLFERAYTAVPHTLASHATMFTGLTPREHGIHDNGTGRLSGKIPVLADILRSRGYDTGAFVGAFVLDARFGLNRGFQEYDDDTFSSEYSIERLHRRRSGQAVVDQALKWLGLRGTQPFFCWVHLFDPHGPYAARADLFGAQFENRPYDAGIAVADQQIERVLDYLRRHGLAEQTLVVVAGDHGEGLGEHFEVEHGHLLYNSTLHVPLIFSWPGHNKPGHRVQAPVSLVDLYPTLLDCLECAGGDSARSFKAALAGRDLVPRVCWAETDFPFTVHRCAALRSLTTESWKYIRSPRPELYDLKQDPAEEHNLATTDLEQLKRMENLLTQYESGLVPQIATDVSLSGSEQKSLASLGYIGGASRKSSDPADLTLPDIKDRMPHFKSLADAKNLSDEKRFPEAISVIEGILRAVPDYLPARTGLAEVLAKAGRKDEAADVYRKLLKDEPGTVDVLVRLGSVLAEQGEYADAIAQFQRAIEIDPNSSDPHLCAGEAFAQWKRLPEAQRELEQAVLLDPQSAPAHFSLGTVLVPQGQIDRAIAEFQSAVRFDPAWPAPHNELAVMFAQRNAWTKAIEHARRAVELSPDNADVHYNLGVYHLLQGDFPSAVDILEKTLRLRPDHPHAAEQLQRARDALKPGQPPGK